MTGTNSQLQKIQYDFSRSYLLLALTSAIIGQILVIPREYPNIINSSFVARMIFIAVAAWMYVQKGRIGPKQTFYLVSIFLTLIYFLSLLRFGIFSPMKWFPLIVSFGLIFFYSFNRALLFSGILLILLLILAYLHHTGTLPYFLPPDYLYINPFAWATDLEFIVLGCIMGIYTIHHFRTVLQAAIQESSMRQTELNEARATVLTMNANLAAAIEEKVSDLRDVVQKLDRQNADLLQLNESISAQNKEIEATTALLRNTRQRMVVSDRLATIGMFTAGVCHEIKNPLSQLINCREILVKRVKPTNEYIGMERFFTAMEVGMDRIKGVLERLNRYRDSGPLSSVQVDVLEQIRTCLKNLDPSVTRRIRFNLDSSAEQVPVRVEPENLSLVIQNILANAVESIEDTGMVNILVVSGTGKVIVEFSDNGCGIPDDQLPSVTDPFFTTKSAAGHVGLGLYQVQAILNDCGGQLVLDSVPGTGTIARLTFISPQ